ncbi:MAG: hypothetical protein JWM62_1008 [Frankiales bacterium]|jgi:hypothetical protein|nr:hypothetical protein [Frankiales bacterium]
MTRLNAEQRGVVAGGLLTVLGAAAGVLLYLASDGHSRHDPRHELQQLDLLYLDEPAPGFIELGLRAGEPAVVVFCADDCTLPDLSGAHVLRSDDMQLARLYDLGEDGRTGYALVDPDGDVRYRSYDPSPHEHETELQTLVDAL